MAETEALERLAAEPPIAAEIAPEVKIEEFVSEVTEASTAVVPELAPAEEVEVSEAAINTLENARTAITQGDSNQAIVTYSSLIKQNLYLPDVIKDLQEALYRFPVDINLWITLGDAYLRTNDFQEALNTYSKAEDLVR
jgi:tetratricopeptide (TPR) repeat protein